MLTSMSYPTEEDNEDEVQCIAVMTPGRQRKNKKYIQSPCMQMPQDIATLPPSFFTPDSFVSNQTTEYEKPKKRDTTLDDFPARCEHCRNIDCDDLIYGGFIAKSLENLAISNNKETLSHMEVYKHFYQTYNILAQFEIYKRRQKVATGVLAMPSCLYKGTYALMMEQWNSSNDGTSREQVCEHVRWVKNQQREKRRKRKVHDHFNNF